MNTVQVFVKQIIWDRIEYHLDYFIFRLFIEEFAFSESSIVVTDLSGEWVHYWQKLISNFKAVQQITSRTLKKNNVCCRYF